MAVTELEKYKAEAERMNAKPGTLEGYDCPICNNEGIVYIASEYHGIARIDTVPCSCLKLRHQVVGNRIENYKAETDWQKRVKDTAVDYIKNGGDKWFFIGGQVGTGKTLICSALLNELGDSAEVLRWTDGSKRLKSIDTPQEDIDRYKKAKLLYIDDLFFSEVTEGDKRLARELIDYRYERGLKTIISTEKVMVELKRIDEGTAGRIREKSGIYELNIGRDDKRDYRWRNGKV